MQRRLPPDAFVYYAGLGLERSYERVAKHFRVHKRTVTKHANREKWQQKLEEIEVRANRNSEKRIQESFEAISERHLKSLRIIQAKALEALRGMRLTSAMDAIRAIEIAIKQERVVLGEPSERRALSVEDVVKSEYQRWMIHEDDAEDPLVDAST